MTNKLLTPERLAIFVAHLNEHGMLPEEYAEELLSHIAASARAINRMADGLEVLANCGANACVIVGPNDELTGASTYASWVLEHPDVTAIRALKDKPHG